MIGIKTYSELSQFKTFEERFEYLKLNGEVCHETFGYDRYMNQVFYKSARWRKVRDSVIIRDCGNDLGVNGKPIRGHVIVHHMNPLRVDDIECDTEYLLNEEYLVCVSDLTHRAIHYGDGSILPEPIIERAENDTCPWKNI